MGCIRLMNTEGTGCMEGESMNMFLSVGMHCWSLTWLVGQNFEFRLNEAGPVNFH